MIETTNANVRGDARGCGELLREARESAGLGVHEVASRLRMPVRVVEALEQERWQVIGAPVFVRGQLRSYSRLLGLDLETLLPSDAATPAQVELVSHAHTPPLQRAMESAWRRAVYVVITAAIVVPVWLFTRSHFTDAPPTTASLDALPPAATGGTLPSGDDAGTAAPQDGNASAPYIASMAPPVAHAQSTAQPTLELAFSGESWMQVTARKGGVLEQGLMRDGDTRSFKAADVASVVLGNAAVVRVQQAAGIVDLTPYERANVARFAVSSDGSVTPAE